MKISFVRSGGHMGLVKGCELDTDAMAAGDAASLRELVEGSGIMEAKGGHADRARDLFQYDITVETEPGVHTVTFDDVTLPEQARPLIRFLSARATPMELK